jgi:dUTP pyrophosphatase
MIDVRIVGNPPVYQTAGSAGADLVSAEDVTIDVGRYNLVSTGIHLEVPEGYECQIRARSGLAAKHGVTVLNGIGTVDSDYRGLIKVILINHGDKPFVVKKGDRIAQAVFAKVERAWFTQVDELTETDRGSGGFGSTGVK